MVGEDRMSTNVLVVGGGAREHAMCSALCASADVKLFSVMNNLNPGIERLATQYSLEKETNIDIVINFAQNKKIDLVVIGPEAPLEAGITDVLIKKGFAVCAPTQAAARIETNKEWMRMMLTKYHISGQLKHQSFQNVNDAKQFIEELDNQVVIKPIGLTGGKGVWVADDHFHDVDGALKYVEKVITERIGGAAKVLLEEKAVGEEFTVQAFSDGKTILPLPAVQDHKRLLPNDAGPNTGGMGSYSCGNGFLPFLQPKEYAEAVSILHDIVGAMNREGCTYIGPIYGQFMLTKDGPKIIEINARFGDPENMNVLSILKTDFLDLCYGMVEGILCRKKIDVENKATVCKYVVPEGYGTKSMVGKRITVDEKGIKMTGSRIFYASVNRKNHDVYTTSSRSLAVVGIAESLEEAEKRCEQGLSYISGDHLFIRHDIGTKKLIEKRIHHMNHIRGSI